MKLIILSDVPKVHTLLPTTNYLADMRFFFLRAGISVTETNHPKDF